MAALKRKKALSDDQQRAVERVVAELLGSGQLREKDEPIALVGVKLDVPSMSAEDQHALGSYTRRLSLREVPPRVPTAQRAAAERQAARIEKVTSETSEGVVRERMGPVGESLAATIRSRGVPLHGRDLDVAMEALRTGNTEPVFVEPYIELEPGGRPRGLNPVAQTLNESEVEEMKNLIARAAGRPSLFEDEANQRIVARLMRRIKAPIQPLPRRSRLAEPGSIELPSAALEDLLREGELVEDHGQVCELIGCTLPDLAILTLMLFMFDRREAYKRGWSFESDADGGPVLVLGSSRNNPFPPRCDPDGKVGSEWKQSIGRLAELGWFTADAGCKRIGRGPRLIELDALRGVETEKLAKAVAS